MLRSSLLSNAGFFHAVSDASFGNLSFTWDGDGSAVKNRVRFLTAAGISLEECVSMSLIHGDTIRLVSTEDRGKGMTDPATLLPAADAFITKDTNVFLFMLTADCLPVSVADPATGHCALIHCGWRSVDTLLTHKVIAELITLGSNPKDLLVSIGPGILPASYVFTAEEIAQAKDKHSNGWQPFVHLLTDGRVSVDIPGYIRSQLIGTGIVPDHIEESRIDTATDRGYFSHYRSVRTGEPEARFATVLGRKA